jgi:hypothetical protein
VKYLHDEEVVVKIDGMPLDTENIPLNIKYCAKVLVYLRRTRQASDPKR